MIKFYLNLSFIAIILINSMPITASDIDKEMRWFEQINESIMTGDTLWLEAGTQQFLGIYTASETEQTLGGIIVVHGLGIHPNWDDVIQPLRTQLPENGWATLSIQMPILQNNAKFAAYLPLFEEVPKRFEAAITFLQGKGINNLIIVAHSLGSTMSIHYLSKTPDNPIKAFVGIGTPSDDYDDKLNTAKAFSQLRLPIYDLYGENDLEQVIDSAVERKMAGNHSKNQHYTQEMVPSANHFFARMETVLVTKVNDWLMLNANQTPSN